MLFGHVYHIKYVFKQDYRNSLSNQSCLEKLKVDIEYKGYKKEPVQLVS